MEKDQIEKIDETKLPRVDTYKEWQESQGIHYQGILCPGY